MRRKKICVRWLILPEACNKGLFVDAVPNNSPHTPTNEFFFVAKSLEPISIFINKKNQTKMSYAAACAPTANLYGEKI